MCELKTGCQKIKKKKKKMLRHPVSPKGVLCLLTTNINSITDFKLTLFCFNSNIDAVNRVILYALLFYE